MLCTLKPHRAALRAVCIHVCVCVNVSVCVCVLGLSVWGVEMGMQDVFKIM